MKNLDAIQSLVTENSEYSNKLNEASIYANKWDKTGLLNDLKGVDRINTAILLENQARQLLKEASSTTTAGGGEEWSGVALPLVRRVIDNIVAKDLVAMQPMSLPTGLVFYLDFVENIDGNKQSVYGDVEHGAPVGGLYGSNHKYTDGSSFVTIAVTDETSTAAGEADATLANVNYNSDIDLTKYNAVKISVNRILDDLQLSMHKQIKLLNDTTELPIVPEFTKVYNANGKTNFVFIVEENGDHTAIATPKVEYPSLTVHNRTGQFEDRGIGDLHLPEIEMKLSQTQIIAKIRKLKAVFSPEIQQDLQAYHAIDANLELTKMLTDKITAEIDLEILSMLANGADKTNTEKWSAIPGMEWDEVQGKFVDNDTYMITSKTDWFRTLGIKIQKISNMIYRKTLMGGANFAVVSPDVATILESFPGYNAEMRSIDAMSFGVQEVGVLNNSITVYKNPYWTTNVILLGHKGSGSLDTGAVYAPYIPLMVSPLVMSADNFTPRKAISSRYATKMLRNCFFGVIYVHGLETV